MNPGAEGVSMCVLVHVYMHTLAFYLRNMIFCPFLAGFFPITEKTLKASLIFSIPGLKNISS